MGRLANASIIDASALAVHGQDISQTRYRKYLHPTHFYLLPLSVCILCLHHSIRCLIFPAAYISALSFTSFTSFTAISRNACLSHRSHCLASTNFCIFFSLCSATPWIPLYRPTRQPNWLRYPRCRLLLVPRNAWVRIPSFARNMFN